MAVKKADRSVWIQAYDPSRARCHTGRRFTDDVTALSPTSTAKLRAYWSRPQHRMNAPARFR